MDSIKSKKNLPSDEKAKTIAEYADDMKAERIEILDIRAKTSVADFFVICSGTSDTHMKAIAEKVSDRLREEGVKTHRRSTIKNQDGWVLFDYGDVVFHVMLEDKRQFYDLESFWTTMQPDPNLILD